MPRIEPSPAKDPFHFEVEDLGIAVDGTMHAILANQ